MAGLIVFKRPPERKRRKGALELATSEATAVGSHPRIIESEKEGQNLRGGEIS